MPDGKSDAIVVYKAPPGASKFRSTDDRQGKPVPVGASGPTAVYHDGMWFEGPGADQRTAGQRTFHWDSSSFHSLTIRAASGTWGIRGPKSIRVSELVAVAASLVN